MEKKLAVMHQLNDQQKDKVRDLMVEIDNIQMNVAESKQNLLFITRQLVNVMGELENLLDPKPEDKFPF